MLWILLQASMLLSDSSNLGVITTESPGKSTFQVPVRLVVQNGGTDDQLLPKHDWEKLKGMKFQPFGTPKEAIDVANILTQNGVPVRVDIKAGRYRLTQPLVIEKSMAPLTIAGESREKVIFSGSQIIEGWRVMGNGRWQCKLPQIEGKPWGFSQMFVNDSRRPRPRWPKDGYSHIEKAVDPLPENADKGSDGFVYPADSIRADWSNREDVEILNWLEWNVVRGRVASIDTVSRTIRFRRASGIKDVWARFKPTYRFLSENVKEALSLPGEWYLDRPSSVVTYIPRPGESPMNTVVEAPRAGQLLVVRESENLTLSGISFEETGFETPTEGRYFYQAEADLNGAVRFDQTSKSTITGCGFSRLGEYAIKIAEGCQEVTVSNCTMTDLGGGGVLLGQMDLQKDTQKLTQKCTIHQNSMLGLGRIHPASVGVWVGQNPYNTISENWIEDLYYTGISVGWSWGYQESGSHHNSILNNTMNNLGQKVLSDMGGIYTLSPSPGTVISGNRVSNVDSYSYGAWGLYTDEGSTGIVIENNVTYQTKGAGFHQHYGRDNVIQNNVFALGREMQLQRSRDEEHLSFTVTNNIFYFDNAPVFGPSTGWMNPGYKIDQNLYWEVNKKPFNFGEFPQSEWNTRGQDRASLIADPLFRDPARGDFRFKPGSPYGKIGFRMHPRLGPISRPDGLPGSIPRAFPEPKEFFPPIWN